MAMILSTDNHIRQLIDGIRELAEDIIVVEKEAKMRDIYVVESGGKGMTFETWCLLQIMRIKTNNGTIHSSRWGSATGHVSTYKYI